MVVITPYLLVPNITQHKKYVIEDINKDMIKLRNDAGMLTWYLGIEFVEPDIYHTINLLMTFNRFLDLATRPLKSLQ